MGGAMNDVRATVTVVDERPGLRLGAGELSDGKDEEREDRMQYAREHVFFLPISCCLSLRSCGLL